MRIVFQTTSRVALIALLAGAPAGAFAQDANAQDDQAAQQDGAAGAEGGDASGGGEMAPAEGETAPAEGEMAPAEGEAAGGAEMAPAEDQAAPAGGEQAAQPVEGQITLQSEDTILADNLMGAAVYSGGGEKVGDISNMIIGLDGTVQGVVIGVGGFLGIGQKSVALEMASLQVSTDDNGNPRLVTNSTKADLEAAPEFVTAQQQQAQQQAEEAQQTAPTTGAGGGVTNN